MPYKPVAVYHDEMHNPAHRDAIASFEREQQRAVADREQAAVARRRAYQLARKRAERELAEALRQPLSASVR